MGEIINLVVRKLTNEVKVKVLTSTSQSTHKPLIIGCNKNQNDYSYAKHYLSNQHHSFIITGVDNDKSRINGLLATSQPIKQRNSENFIEVTIDGTNKYFTFLSISFQDLLPLIIETIPVNSSITYELKQKQWLAVQEFYGIQSNVKVFRGEPFLTNEYFDTHSVKKLIDKEMLARKYLNNEGINAQIDIKNDRFVYPLPHIYTTESIHLFINPSVTNALVHVESNKLALVISLSDIVQGPLLEDVDIFFVSSIKKTNCNVENFLQEHTGLSELTKERLFKKTYDKNLVKSIFIDKSLGDVKIGSIMADKASKSLGNIPEFE